MSVIDGRARVREPDPVVFLDLETTGLDPDRHEIWEIGLIEADGTEHEFHRRPKNAAWADPTALRVTDFYGRTSALDWKWWGRGDDYLAADLAVLTAGKHIVGAVPSFDAAFLARFLRANGQCEAWHYHLIDVEALVAGKFGQRPPWDSAELSRLAGIEPGTFRKHEALEDARWAKAMYESVMNKGEPK